MEIFVRYMTAMFGGGHPTINLVGEFLSLDCPDFGSAIKTVDIWAFLRLAPGPKSGSARYHFILQANSFIDKLPSYRLSRKSSTYSIKYETTAITVQAVKSTSEDNDSFDEELFKTCFYDVVRQLRVMAERLKKRTDFDASKFLLWLDARVKKLENRMPSRKTLRASFERRIATAKIDHAIITSRPKKQLKRIRFFGPRFDSVPHVFETTAEDFVFALSSKFKYRLGDYTNVYIHLTPSVPVGTKKIWEPRLEVWQENVDLGCRQRTISRAQSDFVIDMIRDVLLYLAKEYGADPKPIRTVHKDLLKQMNQN